MLLYSITVKQLHFGLIAIPPVLNNGQNLYNGKSLPVLMATTVEAVQKNKEIFVSCVSKILKHKMMGIINACCPNDVS